MAYSMEAAMEQSIQQGLNYLVEVQNADLFHAKEAVFNVRIFSNGFNVLSAANPEARGLEDAINRSADHSDTSYRFALAQVFHRAATGFHAQAAYDDAAGIRHPVDTANAVIPAGATRIFFRF